MRIAGGKYKGHLLKIQKSIKIRPTSQLVKEALFDIIGPQIQDSSFLELFAGSGSVGIEALSRGAASVVFVERNHLCMHAIEANLKKLGANYGYGFKQGDYCAHLFLMSAAKAITAFGLDKEAFDFIFLDPPYHLNELKNCLIKLHQYDIVKTHSLVIAEHSVREELPTFTGLKLLSSRKYGETALSFYQKEVQS